MNLYRLIVLIPLLACDAEKDTGEEDSGAIDIGGEDTGGEDTGGEDAAPDVTQLTEAGGCSDLSFTLSSSDRDLVLVFSMASTMTAEAYKTGEPVSATISLATEGTLELHQGNQAADFFCNDACTDTMVIDRTWTASEGTVTVTVTSDGQDKGHATPAWGTITIEDAVLTSEGADDVTVTDLSWEAYVGWLPG